MNCSNMIGYSGNRLRVSITGWISLVKPSHGFLVREHEYYSADFPLRLVYLGHVMSLTRVIIDNDFSTRAISARGLFRFE